jgi:hypothetical protein
MTVKSQRRIYELAVRLLEETRENRVQWQEFGGDTTFYTQLGNGLAVISSEDGDGRHPFRFEIRDIGTNMLGSLSTIDDPFGDVAPASWPDLLAELYAEASRRGRKVEQVLDTMFSALDESTADDEIEW